MHRLYRDFLNNAVLLLWDILQWRIRGKGPGAPLFLDQNVARRAEKNLSDRPPSPAPHFSQGLDDPPPPPPLPYLKVWIAHRLNVFLTHLIPTIS